MSGALLRPLTLVCGPGGSGKSTLLGDLCAGADASKFSSVYARESAPLLAGASYRPVLDWVIEGSSGTGDGARDMVGAVCALVLRAAAGERILLGWEDADLGISAQDRLAALLVRAARCGLWVVAEVRSASLVACAAEMAAGQDLLSVLRVSQQGGERCVVQGEG